MHERDQVDAFAKELDLLIIRFMDEFDLSYAAYVGVLALKQTELSNAALYEEIEDDDERFAQLDSFL